LLRKMEDLCVPLNLIFKILYTKLYVSDIIICYGVGV